MDKVKGNQDILEALQQQKYLSLKRRTIGAILLALPVVMIKIFFMRMPYANIIM